MKTRQGWNMETTKMAADFLALKLSAYPDGRTLSNGNWPCRPCWLSLPEEDNFPREAFAASRRGSVILTFIPAHDIAIGETAEGVNGAEILGHWGGVIVYH